MTYRRDLLEVAAYQHGVITLAAAEDAGVPGVEMRKLAQRGALESFGNGVYLHVDVARTPDVQPALAVALGGEGAVLHREAVLDLMGLGHFNPPKIRVATPRRVRRSLPSWIELQRRTDLEANDITTYREIRSTTVARALKDVMNVISELRWNSLVDQAHRYDLINEWEYSDLTSRIA